jgi:hypothetical protein
MPPERDISVKRGLSLSMQRLTLVFFICTPPYVPVGLDVGRWPMFMGIETSSSGSPVIGLFHERVVLQVEEKQL